MNALPVEDLLASLGEATPCGADLEYDPAFLALEEAARSKPEQQFGDTVIPPEEPDWREVHEQALALAYRTRDLRVAVMLARAGARLHGVTGYADAVALIAGLLERHWTHVFPLLDADDHDDPTMRVNALSALSDPQAGLGDLRRALVVGGRAALTVRQVELSTGKVQPSSIETVPAAEAVNQALAEAQGSGLLARLQQLHSDLQRIEAVLSDKLGTLGPDLRALLQVARHLSQAAAQAAGSAQGSAGGATDATAEADGTGNAGSPTPVAAAGALRSRDDVVRTLDRVCQWIEQNEPSNPAPLLIRRAQRLMSKSFLDLIRDLAPDGLHQIEKIAGTPE